MAIPEQVRRQREQAEAIMAQQMSAQSAEVSIGPVERPDETLTDSPDLAADMQSTDSTNDVPSPNQEPSQPELAGISDPMAEQLQTIRAELEKSEQRFRTLQGMIRAKDEEIKRLELLLSQMAEATKSEPTPTEDSFDDTKDRQEFGSEFVDMVYRAIDRKIAKLQERLGTTERVAKEAAVVTQQTQQERFFAALAQRVPDWREIDSSPEFIEWLQSSRARVSLVKEGMANFDVDAIADIFEQYKALTGKGQTQATAEPARNLERKVAPSRGKSPTTPASTEKRIWTRSEIAQVFRDRRKYSQKEFDALQREIFSAQREGRVDFTR